MDFTGYILFLLVIGVLCLYLLRFATKTRNRALRRRYEKHAETPFLKREKERLVTPWGWPGHMPRQQFGRAGLTGTLHSLVERMTREKQLAADALSDPRRCNSIRALLEDRYGRVNRERMSAIEYRRVKPPLLRDPSEPHDQMDNFGTAKAERIRHKLQTPAVIKTGRRAANKRHQGPLELKDIKLPWGW